MDHTRRALLVNTGAALATRNFGNRAYAATGSTSIKTVFWGSDKGLAFELQYPSSVGFRHGSVIDALLLNHNRYGGSGGTTDDSDETALPGYDYWSSLEVRNTHEIEYLRLVSHQGINLVGGAKRSGQETHLIAGARILRVGGKYDGLSNGNHLNQLVVEYVDNFVLSTEVVADVGAVLGFVAGKQTIHEFKDEKVRRYDSFKKMTELTLQAHFSTSAEAQYYATFKAQTDLDVKSISRVDIENTLEMNTERQETMDTDVADGETAVAVCRMRVMKDAEGNFWTYPTSPIAWPRYTTHNARSLIDHFDLSGGLDVQLYLSHVTQYGMRRLTARRH